MRGRLAAFAVDAVAAADLLVLFRLFLRLVFTAISFLSRRMSFLRRNRRNIDSRRTDDCVALRNLPAPAQLRCRQDIWAVANVLHRPKY